MIEIFIKRIYESPADGDGYRVLVDRLWPRGVAKSAAKLDEWAKAFAPSNALRRQFHAAPERYDEFSAEYRAELTAMTPQIREWLAQLPQYRMTLLTATKDFEYGHAGILRDFLESNRSARIS